MQKSLIDFGKLWRLFKITKMENLIKRLCLMIILFNIIILSSCSNKKNNYYLDDNIKYKLSNQNILIYINKNGQLDTFKLEYLIENVKDYYDYNSLTYYEEESILIKHEPNNFDTSTFIISINKSAYYKYQDIEFSSSIKIDEFWYINSKNYIDFFDIIEINSVMYNNVYLFWDPDVSPTLEMINKVYYSHQYGIIKYEKSTGEVWELKR